MWLIVWFILISAVTAAVTAYDKFAAIKGKRRVPERTLFILGAAGGAAAELFVMLLIRHKTRHFSFMLGLPVMIAAQAVIVYLILKN